MHGTSGHLSIAVVAAHGMGQRCQAILASAEDLPVHAHDVGFAGASRVVARYQPRVLLLDAVASPLRALRMLPTLRRLSPRTGVIVINGNRTPTAVMLEALRRGACGHITERNLESDLLKAVRTVATLQQAWVPRTLEPAIVAELRAARRASKPERPRLRVIPGGRQHATEPS